MQERKPISWQAIRVLLIGVAGIVMVYLYASTSWPFKGMILEISYALIAVLILFLPRIYYHYRRKRGYYETSLDQSTKIPRGRIISFFLTIIVSFIWIYLYDYTSWPFKGIVLWIAYLFVITFILLAPFVNSADREVANG